MQFELRLVDAKAGSHRSGVMALYKQCRWGCLYKYIVQMIKKKVKFFCVGESDIYNLSKLYNISRR